MSAPYIEATLYSFTESEIAGEMDNRKEVWARDLKGARGDILSRLQTVFKDFDAFQGIMVNRQLPAYESYVNPSHPKAKKAITRLKLKWNDPDVYTKFSNGIQSAFSEGGAFEQGVDAQKGAWADRTKIVARIVGIRPVGISMAPKLMMILRGQDPTPYLLDVETFTDTGIKAPLVDPNVPEYVVMSVIPVVVDGAYWHYAYKKVGLDTDAETYLSDIKTKLQNLLTKIIDTDTYSLDAFDFTFDASLDRYKIYLKVSKTAT